MQEEVSGKMNLEREEGSSLEKLRGGRFSRKIGALKSDLTARCLDSFQIQMLAPSHRTCVTLSNVLDFFVPQFLICNV